MPDGFRSIQRSRAFEEVGAQVERSIADGRYLAGERLPSEREMAKAFGVSRIVIREAMRSLESRGYVAVRQGSGTYVLDRSATALSKDVTLQLDLEASSLVDLYVVRQALELTAVRLAAAKATPEGAEAIESHLKDMQHVAAQGLTDHAGYMAFSRTDEGFHQAIASASGNAPLRLLLSAVLPLFTTGREAILHRNRLIARFISPAQLAVVIHEHENIALAIRNGDANAAEYFMQGHMQRSIAAWTTLTPEVERAS